MSNRFRSRARLINKPGQQLIGRVSSLKNVIGARRQETSSNEGSRDNDRNRK